MKAPIKFCAPFPRTGVAA